MAVVPFDAEVPHRQDARSGRSKGMRERHPCNGGSGHTLCERQALPVAALWQRLLTRVTAVREAVRDA